MTILSMDNAKNGVDSAQVGPTATWYLDSIYTERAS